MEIFFTFFALYINFASYNLINGEERYIEQLFIKKISIYGISCMTACKDRD